MEEYLAKWIRIIEEMKNDNTYKTAWGRGIVECVYLKEYRLVGDEVIMKQSDIANKMIKYYWNQTFFFGLEQGKNPVILQKVQLMIDKYKTEKETTYPLPWNQVEEFFLNDEKYYNKIIRAIISNARTNVCPRFKNVSNGETLNIYNINHDTKELIFDANGIAIITEYAFVLSKLFNYKWAQLLERYNTAPNISNKVSAASSAKIRRSSLAKYKKLLLEYYHGTEIKDFYTGEVLEINDIHIDHVIPWSFVYSDDIWNLVVTKSTNNLQKSNRPPTKTEIENLKIRNDELFKSLRNTETSYRNSLEYAREHNTLDKLYVNMKG